MEMKLKVKLKRHSILDLSDVLRTHSDERSSDSKEKQTDGWDEWNWEEDDDSGSLFDTSHYSLDEATKVKGKATSKSDQSAVFKDCIMTISREASIFVIAKSSAFHIYKLSSDENEQEDSITIQDDEKNDTVTALSLVPFTKRGCIVVGYSSGFIKIYNETGTLLFSKLFHKSPVQQIKLRTCPLLPGHIGEQTEDLSILYPGGVMVNIDGLSLFSLLHAQLLQIEKEYNNPIQNVLSFRKWELVGQQNISDVITVGIPGSSPFGTLHPLKSKTRIIAVGKHPMISYYVTNEEESPFSAAISIASTVTTKLTSAVFSFAKSWWSKPEEPIETEAKEEKIEKATTMYSKWSLSDAQRQVQSIVHDPTGRLSATTDTFGRIFLLDNVESIVVRMWKGYRDAVCGWVQYPITDPNKEPFALFLVIYAPKRGILEVWRMRNGAREAIMDVGMGCRLLSTQSPLGNTEGNYQHARCYLLQPDCTLSEIVIERSQ